MEKLLIEYKRLKSQLTENVGCEESIFETSWNDGITEQMENLLKDLPKDVAQSIRLGHF